MALSEGDKSPNFDIEGDLGPVRQADLKGKPFILFFYPRDNTPGCTREAEGFQAAQPQFLKSGVVIVGISRDSIKSHGNFRTKHDLTFALGSDVEGTVCEAYGVWVEKKNYGRTYMGIERSTFLVDKKGKVAKIWRKVKVNGHVEDVLAAMQEL